MLPAAEQRMRVKITSLALKKFASGRPLTRKEAFESHDLPQTTQARIWHAKVIKNMEQAGLVETIQGRRPRFDVTYRGVDASALLEIAGDRLRCAELIWPKVTVDDMSQGEEEAIVQEPVTELTEQSTAPIGETLDNATIIKLLAATIENVIYIREKVDKLERMWEGPGTT